ncbi:hypothetical protein C5167_017976 [Papaver somniferum]|uniref:Uncharacterized protein n=1 Tax=Papaver somniferum TaxID=3469 RepID=A0A4Y7IKY1_PAPSO|nr:protein ENHANCED PSEUDOMONAS SUSCEPTIBILTY 1-like [Papaver somniferum]RZC49554.1 hypothetical protein C5167_017976 [Papaver somniferum]
MSVAVAEVRRVSKTKVQPASYVQRSSTDSYKRIDLNPWDTVYMRQVYMQRGLIFSKFPERQEDEEEKSVNPANMITHLKTSLSYTLDYFFPLAGRLGIQQHEDDNTISVYIDCNFEGADFIHATADISVEDVVAQPYVPPSIIDPLFSLNGVRNYEGQSHPLLSIQITELLDGVLIGLSANHCVCDGTAFWHFINIWSEISRSSNYHTSCPPRPVFERWFFKDTDCPIRLPSSLADQEISPVMNINNAEAVLFEEGRHVEKCFHFTKTNIAKLKERANSDIISETKQNTVVISSLQAVLAHLWVAVLRATSSLHNNYDGIEETSFGFVADIRTKLIPPLPEGYFGNSASYLNVTAKDDEVLKRGFGFLASLLKEVVSSNNNENIRSTIEKSRKKPSIFSSGEAGIKKKVLMTRSSHRFNMYGNDFGWGRPIAMRTGIRGKSNGMTTVNEGPVEGSIDIDISLPIEVFQAMEKDAEFMEIFLY